MIKYILSNPYNDWTIMAGIEIGGIIFPDSYGGYRIYRHDNLGREETKRESKHFLIRVRKKQQSVIVSATDERGNVIFQKLIPMPLLNLNEAHNQRVVKMFTSSLNSAFRAGKNKLDHRAES